MSLTMFSKFQIPYLCIMDIEDESFQGINPMTVPSGLAHGWLDFLKFCPKNLLQLVASENISSLSSSRAIPLGYRLSVFFSENYHSYDLQNLSWLCPQKFAVLFIQSEFIPVEDLKKIDIEHLFVCYFGKSKGYLDQLRSHYKETLFNNPTSLIELLVDFVRVSNSFEKEFKDILDKTIKNWPKGETFVISNFNPGRTNRLFFLNATRENWFSEIKAEQAVKFQNRSDDLYQSLIDLDSFHLELREDGTDSGLEMSMVSSSMPALFIVQPYMNSKIFELKNKRYRNAPFDTSSVYFKSIRNGLYTKQNCENYTFPTPILEDNTEDSMKGFGMGASIHANRISALDNIVFLHASFHNNPVLRLPMRGKAFDQYLKYFSPEDYRRTRNFKKLKNQLKKVGNSFLDCIKPEFEKYIEKRGGQVVAVSDLPLEWMNVSGIPLFMLSDTCRLLETSHGSLMSQYVKSMAKTYSIGKDILNKVLVVCLSPDDLEIFHAFKAVKELSKTTAGMENINFEVARTKKELSHLIKKHKPEILVIDTHGINNPDTLESVLCIGEDKLTGEDVIKYDIKAPVVLLSCCFSAPTYGYINPIAHAFFENGGLVVLSTLLPIDIFKGTSLYYRILRNLSKCAKERIHPNLLNFLSHVIRTSVFEDYTMPLLNEFKLSKTEAQKYLDTKLKWYMGMIDISTRKNAFKNIENYILDCFPKRYEKRVKNYLNATPIIFDSYYYTILGRADLIPFDVFE